VVDDAAVPLGTEIAPLEVAANAEELDGLLLLMVSAVVEAVL
jgi:hypothetical protein